MRLLLFELLSHWLDQITNPSSDSYEPGTLSLNPQITPISLYLAAYCRPEPIQPPTDSILRDTPDSTQRWMG